MTPQAPKAQRTKPQARDPHSGPVPDSAWERGTPRPDEPRAAVEIFNATRPGGLDGWTMDADQYQAVHDLILDIIDDDADPDGTIRLQHVVDTIQDRLGASELFLNGRLTNYVRYTKTDMEARCEIERIPRLRAHNESPGWRTTL